VPRDLWQRFGYLTPGRVHSCQDARRCQRAKRGDPQQAAFRGRKPRRISTVSPRPTHGTDRRIPSNSGTSASSRSHDVLPIRIGNIWQCGRGDTRYGRPSPGRQAAYPGHHRRGGLRTREGPRALASELARASRLWAEYYVISIESEDADMSIRTNILTTVAITLIATAPAWSQSLLKTLDPDHDGTVDLAEAKSAASKLFDKLDRDHDGTLDKRELRGRLNAKDFAAADPDNDGTLDKNEFLALVEKRFNAANPDNDGTIDAKELKTAAGRSLARLLK